MEDQQTSLAQRSREKLHFEHADMDYYLSWIIGREIYAGSERGECMETAARIQNGNIDSWQREWGALAAQVEAEADAVLKNGDSAAARGAYLRASTYYRAPLFVMKRQAADFDSLHAKMQTCFRNAAVLFDPPIAPIEVAFDGHALPGYFWKPDSSAQKRPTLIVFGGIETFAEDCYFMLGSSGTARGYNLMTVDLPGQGLNPDQGLYFGARMEIPVKAVLDYAISRPEVDGERLAIFGFSWGGHIVFKGAAYDSRIKAMIANPPMPNVFRAVWAQQQGTDRRDPITRTVFDQIVWRMGLKVSFNPKDIARRFGKAYDYFFNAKVAPRQIPCPTLCLAGEGEAAVTLQIARECYEQLPHPKKKLVIFTRQQGSEAHCQVDNLALPNGVIFDWLDEVFT
jgi:pimeloyl-ACP methyl ester carboxylesterase